MPLIIFMIWPKNIVNMIRHARKTIGATKRRLKRRIRIRKGKTTKIIKRINMIARHPVKKSLLRLLLPF